MTHQLPRLTSSVLVLALSAVGQDAPKQTTKPFQGGAPLVIRTNDRKVAEKCALGLGPIEGELPEGKPEGKEGTCWEISLDDGGKAKAVTCAGPVGYMEISARPGQLLEVFADQAKEAMDGMRAAFVLALSAQGMKAKESAKLAQGFVDFPKQLASIEVKLSGDPDRIRKQGLDVKIAISPVAGSWIGDFIAGLKPGQGAPQVGGDGMMSMSISVDPAELAKISQPMLELVASLNGKSGEEGKKFVTEMKRASGWVDGSMALVWGESGMSIVAGLTDAKAYAEFLQSEAGKALMRSGNSQFDIDVQTKAFEHHGVPVTKSTMKPKDDVDLSQNPVLGKGPIQTYIAIAGNWLVMTMLGSTDAPIKQLIDRALPSGLPSGGLDQKITRAALPDGVLVTMSVDIAKIAEQFAGEKLPQDAPQHMTLAIKRAGTGLGLAIHLK